MVPLQRGLLIVAAVVGVLFGILGVVRDPARWPDLEQPPRQGEAVEAATGDAHPVHAPDAIARLIREPQNSWSNLAFVLGGAYLVVASRLRIARATGVALLAVGVGSFLYHASASRELRHLDVGAMYWLFLLATLLSVGVIARTLSRRVDAHAMSVSVVTLLVAVALTLGRNFSIFGVKPFALHIATALASTVLIVSLGLSAWRDRSWRAWVQAVGIALMFGVAVVCQVGDRPGGWLFAPAAPIQAHALWHVFSAMAFVAGIGVLDRAVVSGSERRAA